MRVRERLTWLSSGRLCRVRINCVMQSLRGWAYSQAVQIGRGGGSRRRLTDRSHSLAPRPLLSLVPAGTCMHSPLPGLDRVTTTRLSAL